MWHMSFYIFFLMFTGFALTATSWVSLWMSLELSLAFLLALGLEDISFKKSESTLKLFLVHLCAGLGVICFWLVGSQILLASILGFKMGLPPFHGWVVSVFKDQSWAMVFFLSSLFKVPPLCVITIMLSSNLLTLMGVLGLVVGSLGPCWVNSLKSLLAYSSIFHSSWLTILALTQSMWLMYMLLYTFISLVLIFQLSSSKVDSHLVSGDGPGNVVWLLVWLGLSGLPPFIGFGLKWVAFMSVVNLSGLSSLALIVLMAFSLYYYFKVMWSAMLTTSKLFYLHKMVVPSSFLWALWWPLPLILMTC